jgi:hypothetical protein
MVAVVVVVWCGWTWYDNETHYEHSQVKASNVNTNVRGGYICGCGGVGDG